MKILAITQARIGSTRFFGKILKEVQGKTLLQLHLQRILKSKLINNIVVATTQEDEAYKIEAIAHQLNIATYKGSLTNVLDRFYKAALPYTADYIVRLTSDCPLIDATIIDGVIEKCVEGKFDYVSNTLNPTFPDGLDVEVFTFKALKKAWNQANLDSEKEHVTPFIWKNSTVKNGHLFTSFSYESSENFSNYRLTVDEEKDYQLIKALIDKIGFNASWKDYINVLEQNSYLQNLNSDFARNEGYLKSIKND